MFSNTLFGTHPFYLSLTFSFFVLNFEQSLLCIRIVVCGIVRKMTTLQLFSIFFSASLSTRKSIARRARTTGRQIIRRIRQFGDTKSLSKPYSTYSVSANSYIGAISLGNTDLCTTFFLFLHTC